MTAPPITVGSDGFYHPGNEAEVIALVQHARREKLRIRARGATHSVAWSIYTDSAETTLPNQTLQQSPPPEGINIAFDRMHALEWIDEANGIVEAEPGIHLGVDPEDPFKVSTLKNSFLHQIFEKGWAVNTLGGITHQTLAGFTATGSAGGSTRHSWDNAIAYRVVDGTGKAEWIDREHPHFDALGTSMGLLGIITRIRLQLVKSFNIEGSEFITPVEGPEAPMDFFGKGSAKQPSLEDYFKAEDYARVVWWPQKGVERIQTWQAMRAPASNAGLVPYEQFPPTFAGQTEMFLGAIVFTLFGNRNPLTIMRIIWGKAGAYLEGLGTALSKTGNGGVGDFVTYLKGLAVAILGGLTGTLAGFASGLVRMAFPKLLVAFNPFTKPGGATLFNDWYWRSLCMDNTVSDPLLGTEFTEIWVPIGRTSEVMQIYKAMFDKGGYDATGYFSTEIYAGPPSSSWMHPGYTDGADEYAQGTLRIDIYWYRDNQGTPNAPKGFFDQFWQVLLDHDIPFRLHWGKFLPLYDFPFWASHYRSNLPRFDDFLAVRAERDPDGVFYTDYWKKRLTGTAEPEPA